MPTHYNEDIDMMGMQQAMGGLSPMDSQGPMDSGMDSGMSAEMQTVQIPSWAVQAVTELVSMLETEIQNGNVTPEMLMNVGGDDPMASAGGMGAMPQGGGMESMMGGGMQ